MQDFTDNPPKNPAAPLGFERKKPSGSVRQWSIEDVKQALRRRLLAAEQEPDEEKRAEILKKAWPLVRTIRRHGWAIPDQALIFASFAMCCSVVLLYLWLFPKTKWRVLEQTGAYEFVLQRAVNGRPLLPELRRFCQGPKEIRPLFEVGMTLTSLKFEERGSCMSIAGEDLGYVIERDANHKPKLARNCFSPADDVPNVCFGPPQFE